MFTGSLGSTPFSGLLTLTEVVVFPCVENTIDVTYGTITVRLWINVPSKTLPELPTLFDGPFLEIKEKLKTKPIHEELLAWLVTLPNINAVQIMESYGDIILGTVIYTVPFEDVHG